MRNPNKNTIKRLNRLADKGMPIIFKVNSSGGSIVNSHKLMKKFCDTANRVTKRKNQFEVIIEGEALCLSISEAQILIL